MDPKKELVQNMMKKMQPGLCKWHPQLAQRLYARFFFPNESDGKEEPDRKRVRRGWKNDTKEITKHACFGSITV